MIPYNRVPIKFELIFFMSSSPASTAKVSKPRKTSDAKTRSVDKKKLNLRTVMKGLLEEENSAESFQQGHKNVLTLVEVLMKELQKLKNTVKKQTEEQSLLIEYVGSLHSLHQAQITNLCSQLSATEQNQCTLRTGIAEILAQCEKKKLYNQNTKQASFNETQIDNLAKLLENTKTSTYEPAPEFNELPGFRDWVIAHSDLLAKQQKAEDEDSIEENADEVEDVKVEEEEAPTAVEESDFDSELEHLNVRSLMVIHSLLILT